MRFGAAFWIQRTGWPHLRDACLAAEAAYLRPFAELGIAEVIWIFRDPFDTETMSRLGDVRAALAH